jgi:hypothetical protein
MHGVRSVGSRAAEHHRHLASAPRVALAVGAIGCLIVLIAMIVAAEIALRAWLAAAFFWTSLPIGALGLLMMIRLIPGAWASELTIPVEAASMLVPLAALALLPVLLGMGTLYAWVGAEQRTAFRGVYLTQWFFALRTVIWFAILCALTFLLIARRRWSTPVSSVGLIVYTLASTLIATDWLMSLDPEFHSSGFGLYVLSIQMTIALAFCVIVSLATSESTVRRPQVLGGLLLTALLLWTYLSFMQFVIIWSGDLPEGVSWYLRRSAGGWAVVLWVIAVLHGIPLFLLMLSPVLRNSRILIGLAATVLVGKALESAWLVLPARKLDSGWSGAALAVIAMLGMGALFAAAARFAFAWRVEARAPDEPAERSAS